MKLYTIGFTQKSARRFFELLQSNSVQCLIDARLHPGGQLSGFAKQDDLRFFLERLIGCEYEHLPELAPEDEFLSAYRKDHNWTRYAEKFLGWQTFRVEEAFCVGQVGGRVVPESALESTRCLALIEHPSQGAPLRQILRLQLGGGEGMLLARGRDQSHAAADQEHRRGDLASARAPLVIAH